MRVDSWISASTVPGAFDRVPSDTDLDWNDAVPPFRGSDDDDHWFRTVVEAAGAAPTIELGGLATVCDVYLDGERVLRSESMFLAHELPVAPGRHELAVCARALTPVLAQSRRPRARWRTRVVADGNLRWVRTSFFGRAPGFAPEPPLVGPWRPVELRERPRLHADVRTVVDGRDGVIEIHCPKSAGELEVVTEWGTSQLAAGGGRVHVVAPEPWWPHTHGDPALHLLHIRTARDELVRRVGFRRLAAAPHPERDGLDLHVNGVAVFARGAVWTPVPPGEVRATLERARDGGLNLIRVVGTMMYESVEFHDACDELGLIVWQDMMFANLDYPFVDESFTELVEAEARQVLREIGGRPSLAVICGNSEIEQQVAMLGLAPELAQSTFFSSTLPSLMRASGIDAQYIPSAPCGGAFPFRTSRGVANYFGVGAYLRPLEDVRRAEVRFASECLAFANVPDEDPTERTVGVMKDAGADWDFADVRDHYLRLLHGVGPDDPGYWDYARFATGEVMAAVFGEWRRAASPCTGGIILWLRDLVQGAGWGLLDAEGRPKVAWHVLRRALAPVAVWIVDEGLNGLSVHVANDGPERVRGSLRVACYRHGRVLTASAEEAIELAPHSQIERDVEAMLGGFVDVTYAYRFGEPQQDVVVLRLERDGELLSEAFHYPVPVDGAKVGAESLRTHVLGGSDETIELVLESAVTIRGIRLGGDGLVPSEDAFDLAPSSERRIRIRRLDSAAATLEVRALDLSEPLAVSIP